MKVKKVADSIWDIIKDGEVIATIESEWRFNRADTKVLWFGKERISAVKNQKEALELVEKLIAAKKKEEEE